MRVGITIAVALCAWSTGALAQDGASQQPSDPGAGEANKFVVETFVSGVFVTDDLTIAVMEEAPESPCASETYVYQRDRPKWLYQTGRLLQALREPAALRISASCVDGYQSINAIQFLPEPPPGLRVPSSAAVDVDASAPDLGLPLPRDAGGAAGERVPVPVPLPGEPDPPRSAVPTPFALDTGDLAVGSRGEPAQRTAPPASLSASREDIIRVVPVE